MSSIFPLHFSFFRSGTALLGIFLILYITDSVANRRYSVDPQNTTYSNGSYGSLYSKDVTILYSAPGRLSGAYRIPSSITDIRYGAFYKCASVETVVVPDGITEIDHFQFGRCSSLKKLYLPASITEINMFAFVENNALTDVYFTGTQTQWDEVSISIGNDPLTDTTMYYNATFPSLRGWQQEGSRWAYYENGSRVKNRWVRDSTGWCYVNDRGYMLINGWAMDSTGWCYLGSDGHMVTDQWIRDSVSWCYIGADGYMLASTSRNTDGKTYYFNAGGVCTNL